MSHGSSTRHALRRRGLRRMLAAVAACALVLQGWLGWPLALRMADAAVPGGDATLVLCTAAGSERAAPDRDGPGRRPGTGHEHQTCLVCQGGFGPLFLLALWSPPVPEADAAPHGEAWTDRLPVQLEVTAYAPRAPPVNA